MRCDSCYDFVQAAANNIRKLAEELRNTIAQIESTPIKFTGENFQQKLNEISQLASDTLDKASSMGKSTQNLTDYVDRTDIICDDILYKLNSIEAVLEELKSLNYSNNNTLDKLMSHVQETEEYVQKLSFELGDGEKLLLLVQETANQISANKSALLEQLQLLESISEQHRNSADKIMNISEYAHNYTEEALRLLKLVQTFEFSLEDKKRIISNNLGSFDWSIGEELQQYYDFVFSVYELTLRAFNEVNKPVPEYDHEPFLQQAKVLNLTLKQLENELLKQNESNGNLASSSSDIREDIDQLISTSRELNKNLSIFLVQLFEMESGLNATATKISSQYYSGLERLALLKGYENASKSGDGQNSFEEQYLRIPSIRNDIEQANEKSLAGSASADGYESQVNAVYQNAKIRYDEMQRQKTEVTDVNTKLNNMGNLIEKEKSEMGSMKDQIKELEESCEQTVPLKDAEDAQKRASNDASESDKKAKDLQDAVKDTSEKLELLRKSLMETTDFLTDAEIEALKDTVGKLDEISEDLKLDEMEVIADDLEKRTDEMDKLLQQYEKRYLEALEDVQNAEEIASNVKVICQSIYTPIS